MRIWKKNWNGLMNLLASATFVSICVGFINPGVPRGPASTPRLGPSRQHVAHGLAQESKTTGRKGGPVTDRKVWPKRNSARSSTTSAHLSDQSACFGLQPPLDGLSDRKAWPKRYFRLQPCVFDRGSQKPCSPLFSDWRGQNRLRPSDRGRPLGRSQGQMEKASQGRTSQTTLPGTIP